MSKLVKMARFRRRVHGSWKVTLLVALVGWVIFGWAGLINVGAGFLVFLGVFLVRPLMELWFSNQFYCGGCGADVFMEVCVVEAKGKVEGKVEDDGVVCGSCREDARRDRGGGVVFEVVE